MQQTPATWTAQLFLCIAIAVLTVMPGVTSGNVIKLPALHWTSSNRLFKDPANTGANYFLRMTAHIGDSIDLTCPKATGAASDYEYSVIYKVSSKHEFDNCIVNPNNYETVPILKCDKPGAASPVKFTIYFVKYSPVPNALEFEEDKEYYFLSASSGMRDGLGHMSGGLCSKFNMRFSIKIKPQSNEFVNSVTLNKLTKGDQQQQQHHQPAHNSHHVTAAGGEASDKQSSTSKLTKLFASLVNGNSASSNGDVDDGQDDPVGVDDRADMHRDQPQVSKLNLVVSSDATVVDVRFSILSAALLLLVLFNR
jgi:hypothetical protein